MGRVHKYVEDEIKLEVGKKYDIRDNLISIPCPSEFIAQDKSTAVFKDAKGDLVSIYLSELVGRITEHREQFKNSINAWVICNNEPPTPYFLTDALLNRYCRAGFFKTKKEAQAMITESSKELRYGRFTFEELPEPEDDNS